MSTSITDNGYRKHNKFINIYKHNHIYIAIETILLILFTFVILNDDSKVDNEQFSPAPAYFTHKC